MGNDGIRESDYGTVAGACAMRACQGRLAGKGDRGHRCDEYGGRAL